VICALLVRLFTESVSQPSSILILNFFRHRGSLYSLERAVPGSGTRMFYGGRIMVLLPLRDHATQLHQEAELIRALS